MKAIPVVVLTVTGTSGLVTHWAMLAAPTDTSATKREVGRKSLSSAPARHGNGVNATYWPRTLVPPVSAGQFLPWCDSHVRTPSSQLVTLNAKPRYGSGGSDDDTRHDQLKLDAPVKLDGPIDGQV
jgi:hypothetical protein